MDRMPAEPKKPFTGALKEKPILLFHPSVPDADFAFYDGYDPEFIFKKVAVLLSVYKHAELFDEAAAGWGDAFTTKEIGYRGALATEIHCATFHQAEGFIALLLAEFQNRPDWVYLSSYTNREIKEAAGAIVANDFSKASNGLSESGRDFVEKSVYATIRPGDDPDLLERWNRSVQDAEWLIRHVAELYLQGHEYNAYKHGLRVVSGTAALGVKPMGSPESLRIIMTMPHSLTYLELGDTAEGYTADQVTKELDPEYSYAVVQAVSCVLMTTRNMRMARYGQRAESIDCIELNREKLLHRKPRKSMVFPY